MLIQNANAVESKLQNRQLFIYKIKENKAYQITNTTSYKSFIIYSKDNKKFAFSTAGSDEAIFVVDTKTLLTTKVSNKFAKTLNFSDDNKNLIYMENMSDGFYSIDLQSLKETKITDKSFKGDNKHLEGMNLLWSPNGKYLIYQEIKSLKKDCDTCPFSLLLQGTIVSLDIKSMKRTYICKDCYSPSWSNDSKYVYHIFHARPAFSGNDGISKYNIFTKKFKTFLKGYFFNSVVSNRGNKVIYENTEISNLFQMNIINSYEDETKARKIPSNNNMMNVTWSAKFSKDDKRILFNSIKRVNKIENSLFFIDTNGKNLKKIPDINIDSTIPINFVWSSDNNSILFVTPHEKNYF